MNFDPTSCSVGCIHEERKLILLPTAYVYIYEMLQEMCEGAKEAMKALPATELGSWKKAVTIADACWLTRGHFSQYCTSIVKIT